MPDLTSDYILELKYRPKIMPYVILPERLRNFFDKIIEKGKLPNLLLSGIQGTGKTTTALCLVNQLELDSLYINMSLNTGIDTIRSKIITFASSVSLEGKKKVVIGDEFDRLSSHAMDSLKSVIEEFSHNCTFIFTSNHKNKITAPILSRLEEVDFNFTKEENVEMMKLFFKRLLTILKKEKIEYDKKGVGELIKTFWPDMRKILNEVQKLSLQGPITEKVIKKKLAANIETYFKIIRSQDFGKLKQYIVNLSVDHRSFLGEVFDKLPKFVKSDDLPQAINIVGQWDYRSAFAVDIQIPLITCSVELMTECEWR
jgi:DNA polymerase III delta prime subunit